MLVLARIRPSHSSGTCITSDNLETLSVSHAGSRAAADAGFAFRTDFRFSRVLHETASQEDVWSASCEPLQKALTDGEAACVLAYGQTGSGKTHTVFGGSGSGGGSFRERGVAQRALSLVFAAADAYRGRTGIEIPAYIAFAEVYAESVYDLIGIAAARAAGVRSEDNDFDDREDGDSDSAASTALSALALRGVRTFRADTEMTALALVHAGTLARATGATALNRASSRSHALLVITLGRSALFLVDLAGSERRGYGRSAQDESHHKEGASINYSLHCLELVIMSLAERQSADREYTGRHLRTSIGMAMTPTALLSPSSGLDNNLTSSPLSTTTSAAASVVAAPPLTVTPRSSPQSHLHLQRGFLLDTGARRASSSVGTSSSTGNLSKGIYRPSPVHIPFRNSALTTLLRAALASACRPVLIACVSPESNFASETASTCRFAARCALIDARTVPLDHTNGGGVNYNRRPSDASSSVGGGGGGGANSSSGDARSRAARTVALLEARVHVLEAALAAVGVDPDSASLDEETNNNNNTNNNKSTGNEGGGGHNGRGSVESANLSIDAVLVRFLTSPPPPPPLSSDTDRDTTQDTLILPLPTWTPYQIRYAFCVLRDALGVAVNAAAAATADANALRETLSTTLSSFHKKDKIPLSNNITTTTTTSASVTPPRSSSALPTASGSATSDTLTQSSVANSVFTDFE